MQQLQRYCTSLPFVPGKQILQFHIHLLPVFVFFHLLLFHCLFLVLPAPVPISFVLCLFFSYLSVSCIIDSCGSQYSETNNLIVLFLSIASTQKYVQLWHSILFSYLFMQYLYNVHKLSALFSPKTVGLAFRFSYNSDYEVCVVFIRIQSHSACVMTPTLNSTQFSGKCLYRLSNFVCDYKVTHIFQV